MTGVAAININSKTINSGLHIQFQSNMILLNDALKAEVRSKFFQKWSSSLLMKYKLFLVNYFIKYINF